MQEGHLQQENRLQQDAACSGKVGRIKRPDAGWRGYLICVVPGAKLGSVSFAADWYILV